MPQVLTHALDLAGLVDLLGCERMTQCMRRDLPIEVDPAARFDLIRDIPPCVGLPCVLEQVCSAPVSCRGDPRSRLAPAYGDEPNSPIATLPSVEVCGRLGS